MSHQNLPSDCWQHIMKWCPLNDVLSLARVNRSCRDALRSAPTDMWAKWCVQELFQLPPNHTTLAAVNINQNWKEGLRTHRNLLSKLHQLPSPGCQYQKYLRYLQGVPADAPRIRSTLVLLSTLPESMDLLYDIDGAHGPEMGEFGRSWVFLMFFPPDNSSDFNEIDRDLEVTYNTAFQNVLSRFDVQRYLRLFSYIVKDNCEQRLRQMMAEYRQISMRDIFQLLHSPLKRGEEVTMMVYSTARLTGALSQLLLLANGDYEKLLTWAHL
eukprot:c9500_g1_i1.p1 GENE.c9500_g1_i1~~c9500_g1_i1.p1  ORF type:complete len:269 (-),score=44.59 c9500_g1_i1:3-809(-)